MDHFGIGMHIQLWQAVQPDISILSLFRYPYTDSTSWVFMKQKYFDYKMFLRVDLNSKLFLTLIHWLSLNSANQNVQNWYYIKMTINTLRTLFSKNLKSYLWSLETHCWSMASCLQERILILSIAFPCEKYLLQNENSKKSLSKLIIRA